MGPAPRQLTKEEEEALIEEKVQHRKSGFSLWVVIAWSIVCLFLKIYFSGAEVAADELQALC